MLRDLKSDLQTLKYGKDVQGGGYSGKPYIQKTPNSLALDANLTIDFPVRGGALALIRSVEDTVRIGKFFLDAPRGPLFIAKQVGLQLSNPKLEYRILPTDRPTSGQGFLSNVGNFIANAANTLTNKIGTTRIYNLGINTLAQVPVNAFGVHFDRHGLLPVMIEQDKYINVVASNNRNNANRLVNLSKALYYDEGAGNNFFVINEYSGGPGSVYGIGRTTIKRTPERTNSTSNKILSPYGLDQTFDASTPTIINWSNPLKVIDAYNKKLTQFRVPYQENKENAYDLLGEPPLTPPTYTQQRSFPDAFSPFNNTLKYQQILKFTSLSRPLKTDFTLQDFRQGLPKEANVPSTNYYLYNMENRIGIGNPGNIFFDRTKVSNTSNITSDRINLQPIMSSSEFRNNPEAGRDLIKFRFEAINNDRLGEDDTNVILFRAFLSGISDNFKGGWKPQKYAGRAENFWAYDDFNRDFAFKFKIAAQTRSEMQPLFQKLNYLKSLTAPDYHPDTGFMRGSFVRLTIGNWLYRQIGILTSVGSTIPDDSPWEIAINEPENGNETTMNELPHVIEVSISFIPIHDFLPKKDLKAGFLDLGRSEPNSAHNWMKDEILGEARYVVGNKAGRPERTFAPEEAPLSDSITTISNSNLGITPVSSDFKNIIRPK